MFGVAWDHWKRDGYAGSAVIAIGYRDTSFVGANNSIDKSQAKAVAGGVATLYSPGKKLRSHVVGKSVAGIAQDDASLAICFPEFENNFAAAGHVLQFVVEEIGNHAMNQAFVSDDAQRTIAFKLHLQAFFRHRGLIETNHRSKQSIQV